MKIGRKGISGLLLAAVICLGLGACGTGDESVLIDNGVNQAPSGTVLVKTGTVATDSWGYTGSTEVSIAAPVGTQIMAMGHTQMLDASRAVVSGPGVTRISISKEKTDLSAAAQGSAPANFVSFVDISVGSAATASPALSVTVDVDALPGQALTVYNYDPGTRRWASAQSVEVNSSQKVTFLADKLSLWAIFR